MAFLIFTRQTQTLMPLSVNPSQHLPRSRQLLLLPVLNKSVFLSVWHFFLRAPYPPLDVLPTCCHYAALLFGNRHLLTSFYGSVSHSDTVCGRHTTCLRILCWGFLSFLVCTLNCLPCAMEQQALVIKQILHWWSRCWMFHQFTQGINFLGFHNITWCWMVLKDFTCFCKLPILFKGSKIFNNVLVYIHRNLSWKQMQA